MPCRRSSDSNTFSPLYGTPRWSKICTTWPENPHIGNCGVPFMNSTTSLLFSSLSMNCSIAMDVLASSCCSLLQTGLFKPLLMIVHSLDYRKNLIRLRENPVLKQHHVAF